MLSPAFFVLLAIAPGIVAWWTGRRFARLTDDPALPELLASRRQRLTTVAATVIAVTTVFGRLTAYWAIPLMAVAMLAGGYSIRRVLAFETGGFAGYLWRGMKSIVGGLGFWMLLVLAPALIFSVPDPYHVVALLLLLVLLTWEEWYAGIWLWLHDAVPLVNSELAPRIEIILQRAGIPAPRLYAIGSASRMVNAFAFPSRRHPSIAFGAALVELLDPDEAAAIYAHELSHIEQHGPRRLRGMQAVNRLLIVLAVAIPVLVQRFAPGERWVEAIWPVVVLGALFLRLRTRQREETESDLRAAEWCGNADAMARALIKVHVHALIPRRWAIDFERRASHPSLARRIQALRGDAPRDVAIPGGPTVLTTARGGTVVVFDDARGYWFDGVPLDAPRSLETLREAATSMRSVAWSELVELRVTASQVDRTLRAVHRNGDTWQVPLEPSQVGDVQRALDRIDLRLQRELGRSPRQTPQLVAALIVLSLFFAGDFLLLIVPATLALLRPSTAALGALGAMAVARAVMQMPVDSESLAGGVRTFGFILMGALGLIAAVIAYRRLRRDKTRDGVRLTLIVVGTLSILLTGATVFAASQLSLSELADLAPLGALAVTLLGLGAASALAGKRGGTIVGVAALGLGALVAGGQRAIAWQLTRASKLDRITAMATEVGRVQLPPGFASVQLSPAGVRFVAQRYDERVGNRARSSFGHFVGTFDGQRRDIDAIQVEFADDELVLALRKADEGYELKLERADRDSIIWSASFPRLDEAKLSVSPRTRAWTLVGFDTNTDSLLVITGTPNSPAGTVHRFADPDSLNATEQLVFAGGSTILVPVFDVGHAASQPLAIFGMYPLRTELWQLSGNERRRVGRMNGYPACAPPESDRTVCFTRQGNGGRIWLVTVDGAMTPLGELRGTDAAHVTVGPGLRLIFAHAEDQVTEIDAVARRITNVRLPSASGYVLEARSAPGRLVVLRQDRVSSITLYRVE
jgi:Zn-dependent protease with chaperone function